MGRCGIFRCAAAAAFSACLLVPAPALAGALVSEQPVSTIGSILQPRDAGFSDTYGDTVVYQDANPDEDIYVFDALHDTKPRALAASDGAELFPQVYGSYSVYYRDGNIYLQNLAGGTPRNLTPKIGTSDPWASRFTDIYRNKVVFSRWMGSALRYDVYLYDITTKTTKRIVSTDANEEAQAIWGDHVVYTTDKDVFVYNLATKTRSGGLHGSSLSSPYVDDRSNRPQVYRNHVVYVAGNAGNDHVFLYDLNTKTETRISSVATEHANPAIHGTRIVFEQGRWAEPELVLYDTRAKSVDASATNLWHLGLSAAKQPSIWGNRLSWTDLRNAKNYDSGSDYYGNWVNEDLYTGLLRVPKITIASPATFPRTVSYSAVTTFVVDVKQPGGANIANGTRIYFESSTDGYTWKSVGSTETVSGRVTFATAPLTRKHYYRFWYNGSATTPATVSSVVVVTPKVRLGTPKAPKTMKKGKTYSVYGSLKPRHTSGTKPVRIYKYRKVDGKWKRFGYVKATASNDGLYSKYKVRLKLTTKGSWRLRAYAPADSRHAATWSSKYDSVTVK